ncbi:MAG: threonine ammonia-lyase [Sphingomonadales bacterium]
MIHSDFVVSAEDVKKAGKRLKGVVTHTPLLCSIELDRHTGARVFVKPECLQKSGSFKFRGAYNRISQLSEAEKKMGVVAFSSGNHGQGIALAAKMEGLKATIVMPEDAPKIKIEKTYSHGATIVFYDRYKENREEISQAICNKNGGTLIPAYDDKYIISGQGTGALEACQDIKAMGLSFDSYLSPIGGGGLMAGSNLIIKDFSPDTKTYCVEPNGYDDHRKSFEAGTRLGNEKTPPFSSCDSLLCPIPGELTFPINYNFIEEGLVVSETEIEDAIRFAFDNLKLVSEPGGVVALAAILSGKIETERKVMCVLISGGNIDKKQFGKILAR